ncbi:MAG: sialate O-acetylesterase [Lentisphaerae bacterium]|nr:sialate O-acetylesterase [Lentisphaerota bacterium]
MTDSILPMEIFLLIGQSNMAGRGPLETVPGLRDPRVYMFRGGGWLPAEEPLHTDKPEIAGVGLAMSFAIRLLEEWPDREIGLLPCAVGGTPLSRWMPGADLYTAAVATTRSAGAAGSLRGILWHQGENDANRPEDVASYGRRLREMVAALRAGLAAPAVPFIAGELGEFLAEREGCRAGYRAINEQLCALKHDIPFYACASAAGLSDKGDRLHFDSAALREFGRRYAAAYLDIAQGIPC